MPGLEQVQVHFHLLVHDQREGVDGVFLVPAGYRRGVAVPHPGLAQSGEFLLEAALGLGILQAEVGIFSAGVLTIG